jgi:tRNA threonylcarbamoyladenosine biosynthesis protein TsaB
MILAIDTATATTSVTLCRNEGVCFTAALNEGQPRSEILLPLIHQALGNCNCVPADLQAVAVSIGPGSFTGLRIGLAAAKGICAALRLPLIPVSTLELLAHNVSGTGSAWVVPLLYARKNEVYAGIYDCREVFPRLIKPEAALALDELAAYIGDAGGPWLLLGDGCSAFKADWQNYLTVSWQAAPEQTLYPRGERLAHLALEKWRTAAYPPDHTRLKPVYLRLSAAEYQLKRGEV